MQSTSCKVPGRMKLKLESRLLGEISITSDMPMIPPYDRKWRWTKDLLIKVKEETEKDGLKCPTQKTEIMASSPITSWQIGEETMETVTDYFLGLQNPCRWWLRPWNQKMFSPWKKFYDKPRQHIKKQRCSLPTKVLGKWTSFQ